MKRWMIGTTLVLGMGLGTEGSALPEISMITKEKKSSSHYGNSSLRACSNENGGAMELDFLWWRAENQGFISAFNQTNPVSFIPSKAGVFSSTSFSLLQPEPVWNPGFRLGWGWNTDYDRWKLFIDWTWYKNHSSLRATHPENAQQKGFYPALLASIQGVAFSDGPYLSLKSSWKLWHNVLDLELKRDCYISQQFSVQTHWGIRGAILKQHFDTTFATPSSVWLRDIVDGQTLRLRNKFWGLGPRVCVDANWLLGKGFSLVGKGAIAGLFGQMKWHSLDLVVPFGSNVAITGAKAGGMFQTLVPNLQLFLGLDWTRCFRSDKILFGLRAGWEMNYWWNQNAIVNSPANLATNNPVTMEGLTVNTHLDF